MSAEWKKTYITTVENEHEPRIKIGVVVDAQKRRMLAEEKGEKEQNYCLAVVFHFVREVVEAEISSTRW